MIYLTYISVNHYRFFTGGIFTLFLAQGRGNGLEKMNKNTFCPARLNALKIIDLRKTDDLWSWTLGPIDRFDLSADNHALIQCLLLHDAC